jgi:hypothetical protein
VFTDRGPDLEGRESPQIFLMDVFGPTPGRRTQVTHVPGGLKPVPTTCCGVFRDRRSIVFWAAGAYHTFNVDGSGLRPLPSPFPAADSQVVPRFTVASSGGNVRPLYLGGEPVNVYPGVPPGGIWEMFLLDGPRLLQLTNFQHSDTEGFLSRRRVFITTSADPLGTNPGKNCPAQGSRCIGTGPGPYPSRCTFCCRSSASTEARQERKRSGSRQRAWIPVLEEDLEASFEGG